MRFKLAAPVAKSSAGTSDPCTIKELEITRGRDREWKRSRNVLYLTGYTSSNRADAGKSALIIALDYADARQLVKHLQAELHMEREHELRIQRAITDVAPQLKGRK